MEPTSISANRLAAALVILMILTFAACERDHAKLSPESARQQLSRRGFEFNEETFIVLARKGDVENIALFLDAGMDVDAADESGRTALMTAAAPFDNVSTVQALIARGASVGLKDQDGMTALIHATVTGNERSLRVLVDAGADVNAADNRGATSLIYAALDGYFECAGALLERGADTEMMTTDGDTALLLLVKHTTESPESSPSWKAAFTHARSDPIRTLGILLERGANIKATNKRGQTVLTLAEENNVPEVINALRSAGANP